MSHLGVLEAAQAARFEAIVVAEDDLDFADVCRTAAPSLAEALRTQPWDILYGGYGHVPAGVPVPGHPTLSELASDEPVLCTHFLWFRGRVIGALADYLHRILERPPGHPDGGPMHVDGALTRFRADHPEFRTFAAIPPLGVQRPSRTDIHALRWFDRNPIVREVAQSLRRVRRSIRRA